MTATPATPAMRPARPEFSSGPCAKRPGWTPEKLGSAVLGRSHRSKLGKSRLQQAIAMTRDVLDVPDDYLIGIVPASDTGAVEMAMWSMLGPRPVQVLAFESFSKDWAIDAVKQLKVETEVLDAPYGELPDLTKVRPDADLVFAWNGTTSGVRVPNADFISADRRRMRCISESSMSFTESRLRRTRRLVCVADISRSPLEIIEEIPDGAILPNFDRLIVHPLAQREVENAQAEWRENHRAAAVDRAHPFDHIGKRARDKRPRSSERLGKMRGRAGPHHVINVVYDVAGVEQ